MVTANGRITRVGTRRGNFFPTNFVRAKFSGLHSLNVRSSTSTSRQLVLHQKSAYFRYSRSRRVFVLKKFRKTSKTILSSDTLDLTFVELWDSILEVDQLGRAVETELLDELDVVRFHERNAVLIEIVIDGFQFFQNLLLVLVVAVV